MHIAYDAGFPAVIEPALLASYILRTFTLHNN